LFGSDAGKGVYQPAIPNPPHPLGGRAGIRRPRLGTGDTLTLYLTQVPVFATPIQAPAASLHPFLQ